MRIISTQSPRRIWSRGRSRDRSKGRPKRGEPETWRRAGSRVNRRTPKFKPPGLSATGLLESRQSGATAVYVPEAFAETRLPVLHAAIEACGLAIFITATT